MKSLEERATISLESIARMEWRWHTFKAVLFISIAFVLILFMTYEANCSVNAVNAKNQRVERLLRCSLPAFTPQNYSKADKIISNCLEIK